MGIVALASALLCTLSPETRFKPTLENIDQTIQHGNYTDAIKSFLALAVCVSCLLTSKGQTPNDGFVFANFLAHEGSYLNITNIGTEFVQHFSDCAFKCLEKDPCSSFNLADSLDNNNNLLCEMLPSDRYTHSDKFITKHLWYHYSIPSPCSSAPCQNKGTCVPLYQTGSYECRCMKAYEGSRCEKADSDCSCASGPGGKQLCKIDYLMVFPEPRSTENFAMKNPAIASDLSQLSVCFFFKPVPDQGMQVVITYATEQNFNGINVEVFKTNTDIFVNNKLFRFNAQNLYNDAWQHVCLTWDNIRGVTKLYKDGKFTEKKTNTDTKNITIKSGGSLVLGQEQDSVGGHFNPRQTLHGRLASFNIWDKVLSESDIAAQYTSCSIPNGSVLNWSELKNLTRGDVTVEEP